MLFLVISLADHDYLIQASHVIEVLPMVRVKPLPQAPAELVGMFDYHGQPVAIIDLTQLAFGVQSRRWMSTRIVVVNRNSDSDENRVIGLLAERATEMLSRSEADFLDSSVIVAGVPYLGRTTIHAGKIVQQIDVESLSRNISTLLSGERTGVG